MTTYRILVTNDDGVGSPGLGVLAQRLAADGHDVFAAAPAVESSGSSAAIGGIMLGDEITIHAAELDDAPSVPAFAVDGPPGRCVLAAVGGAFGAPPDLVLSGINPGANVGRFLQLHSGTLGAVLTAAGFGLNGMAVSIDAFAPTHWNTAAELAARLVDYLAGSVARTSLNLNVPDLALGEVRDIRPATVRSGGSKRLVLEGTAPGVMTINWVDRPAVTETPTDADLVRDGFATLVRVHASTATSPESFPTDVFEMSRGVCVTERSSASPMR